MRVTTQTVMEVPSQEFTLVGLYPVPTPKRVLELNGHRIMQEMAHIMPDKVEAVDVGVTYDDTGAWLARLTLKDGARVKLVLQQELLSAAAHGVRDYGPAIALFGDFALAAFRQLGARFVRGLTSQVRHEWHPEGHGGALRILDQLVNGWERTPFGALSRQSEAGTRFVSQVHLPLPGGAECVVALDVPSRRDDLTPIRSSIGVQAPSALVIEGREGESAIHDILRLTIRTATDLYAPFLATAFNGQDITPLREEV